MIRFLIGLLRDLRLVPIVLVATIALFSLKALGLLLDGGYLLDYPARTGNEMDITGSIAAAKQPAKQSARPPAQQSSTQSWGQQMFNPPDVTGAAGAAPGPAAEDARAARSEASEKKPAEPPPPPNVAAGLLEPERPVSPAERAILESLQKRRAELDARGRELDIREDLLRAAEKRLEGRVAELRDIEARVNETLTQKDEGETTRFKNVVTMYESMKAKDAAKIFDGLDIKVLLDVAKQINPRRMSDILAQMSAETAQRLTTELAARSAGKEQAQAADLPKIQGRPNPN
jgi:flagellar motility protein MotE (MotC chaperone)